jgi:hypothetical protein
MEGWEYVLIGYINSDIGLLCVVVRQESDVGKSPAKNVRDNKDSSVLVVASHVGFVLAEGCLLACGLSVPGKSSFAVFARHYDNVEISGYS